MSLIYLHKIFASEKDLTPLTGCMLTDLSEGAADDGTEVVTLVFYNPGTHKYIRLSIGENSELSISDFETA